ncbi:MAG TPA: hypothetical protein PK438_01795 [Clostridia bacterium]|nr:hypothetical protein [Clostridia bacterium]HOS17994.1 hypothetical protein [Clostridia bacterium]
MAVHKAAAEIADIGFSPFGMLDGMRAQASAPYLVGRGEGDARYYHLAPACKNKPTAWVRIEGGSAYVSLKEGGEA